MGVGQYGCMSVQAYDCMDLVTWSPDNPFSPVAPFGPLGPVLPLDP